MIAICLFVASGIAATEPNVVLENVPEVPKSLAARLNQYNNIRSASFADWLPDGRGLLVLTRFGEANQVHSVGRALGMREQLTFFPEPVAEARVDPARRDGMYLRMDKGGGERFQFYWHDLNSGREHLLTDGVSRHEGLVVSPTQSVVAFASTERNGTDHDIYTLENADPTTKRRIYTGTGKWTPMSMSADGKTVLLQRFVSVNESYLHLLNTATGALTAVHPAGAPNNDAKAGIRDAKLTPDGSAVFFSSDENNEFARLLRYDVKTASTTAVTQNISWDVVSVQISRDSQRLAYVVNEGGRSALYLARVATPARAKRLALPVGVVGNLDFDDSGRRLAITLASADAPADTWVFDVGTSKLERWTASEVGGLPRSNLVAPQLVEFESFDGLKVPAWYYSPRAAKGPVPVIISIHGGPEAQVMASFNPQFQMFAAELGAAVLAPNVRGSSGYGKKYVTMDNGERREDAVKDIGALLDWIATRPELDKDRVAVMGGSYGGYMVLASLVHFGERLRCGVDVVGISNFVTFLNNTESYRRDLRRAEYGDERDPAMRKFLESISPLAHAARIKRPLFVAHGQNDPRVPVGEAAQIASTVRAGGTEVWTMIAKDEGHGFQKKTNRDLFTNTVAMFFEKHLVAEAKR